MLMLFSRITAPIAARAAGAARSVAALLLVAAGAVAIAPAPDASAQSAARNVLPAPGQTGVIWRVLPRPSAVVRESAGGPPAFRPVTFVPLYVFGETTVNGVQWLEISRSKSGQSDGWIQADQTVLWKHAMVAVFTPRSNRNRVLFFESEPRLDDIVQSPNASNTVEGLVRKLAVGGSAASDGVIASEPQQFVDANLSFYLLPILERKPFRFPSSRRLRPSKLKVASVTDAAVKPPKSKEPYRIGVMFVVDATRSMGPFIDMTREAVRDLTERIRALPKVDEYSFGLVAFRDSTQLKPKLEWETKVVHKLEKTFDPDAFDAAVRGLAAAKESSEGFAEDGLAGVNRALYGQSWDGFAGRVIVYITDAPARAPYPQDPHSLNDQGLAQLNADATKLAGSVIISLFIDNPQGRRRADEAKAQMRELSAWGGAQGPRSALLFEVEDGAPAAFRQTVSDLLGALTGVVDTGAQKANSKACDVKKQPILCAGADIRWAMKLQWEGQQAQAQAQPFYSAWSADHALDNPRKIALEPRVLISKNELDTLFKAVTALIKAGRSKDVEKNPALFFDQLRSVAASGLAGPSSIQSPINQLGDFLNEYLQLPPYPSEITSLTLKQWRTMQPLERDRVLSRLEHLKAYYRVLADHPSRWTKLHKSAPDGEDVIHMPIKNLP